MRDLAIVLTILGGAFPLIAVEWARRIGRTRLAVLARAEEISTAVHDHNTSLPLAGYEHPDARDLNAELRAAMIPTTTNLHVSVMRAVIEREITRDAANVYARPALLALAGVVVGTVGGVLSFWT